MAHTVETLSKLLKKSPDQVITILSAAGIDGKTAESNISCLLYTSPSPRDRTRSRMPSSA